MPDELNEYEESLLLRDSEAFWAAQGASRYVYEICLPLAFARAKKQRLGFDLKPQFLVDLMRSQNYACAVSGLSFDMFRTGALGRKDRLPFRPSIDRIDAAGGYTQDNVRIVCLAANVGMSDWGDAVHQEISTAISRRQMAAAH